MSLRSARSDAAIRITFFAWVLIVGAAICVGAVKDYANARASQSWPTVLGVVLEASEDEIAYAYSWEARTYHSSRIRFVTGTRFDLKSEQQWRAGEFIKVYVSPSKQNLSVLEPGGVRSVFALFLTCGAVLAFVGGGGLAVSLTSRRSEKVFASSEVAHQHSYGD